MAGLLDAISSALSGGGKTVTGLTSGISSLLSSKEATTDQNKNSNVIYASFGMAGAAGKQRVVGSGSLPAAQAKSTYRAKTDNTEKLLNDVVRYLVSINGTLKKQIDFDRRVYEENALAAREAKIEQNDTFNELGKRYGANDNQKDGAKGGILSTILSALGSIAKLGLNALFSGLKAAIKGFSTAWKWLRGLSFLKSIKSLAGLVRSILTPAVLRAAGPVGITLGTLLFMDQFMKNTYNEADKSRKGLEKYGMKAVMNEQGFTEGYVLPDGKTYKADNLPSKYKDILDVYGPNNRGGTSEAARKRIEANPGAYDPDTMAKELKGGEQVGGTAPSATQPNTTSQNKTITGVVDGGRGYTTVTYSDGTTERRGGTIAARTNNPGNMMYGPLAISLGAVGSSPSTNGPPVAVFPTEAAGFAAMDAQLSRPKYSGGPIGQTLQQWATDPTHASKVIGAAGIDPNKKYTDLNQDEKTKLQQSIAKQEGYYAPGSGPTISSSSSDGIIQEAADAAEGALTSVAEFIGFLGGKIVGRGAARNLTTSGPDFAKLISDESNKIQNEIAMGQKKTETAAMNIPPAAQSLRSASPNGSISVVDPNYSSGGIDKYLAHYKLAA
jgi:ribosomal protein S13